ncbi:hypothetical protein ACMD2_25427 [Ananas comosus]|uniref:Uncharacterized protein n=1 Tax=Ananas comosus TaxID=4615 RepID=A0A199VTT7_ANACO|nr:hypothetical protein ACMD2_25427 [Ananas comosus]
MNSSVDYSDDIEQQHSDCEDLTELNPPPASPRAPASIPADRRRRARRRCCSCSLQQPRPRWVASAARAPPPPGTSPADVLGARAPLPAGRRLPGAPPSSPRPAAAAPAPLWPRRACDAPPAPPPLGSAPEALFRPREARLCRPGAPRPPPWPQQLVEPEPDLVRAQLAPPTPSQLLATNRGEHCVTHHPRTRPWPPACAAVSPEAGRSKVAPAKPEIGLSLGLFVVLGFPSLPDLCGREHDDPGKFLIIVLTLFSVGETPFRCFCGVDPVEPFFGCCAVLCILFRRSESVLMPPEVSTVIAGQC